MAAVSRLFQPLRVGTMNLQHRVVMSPLTRYRADSEHAHTALGVEYYAQRSSAPGTLLITEATLIAPREAGHPHAPGVWNDNQIAAWKRVTDVVHTNKSFIYCQLWAPGRQNQPAVLAQRGFDYIGAGDVPLEPNTPTPRPLTVAEIKEYFGLFATAAENAMRAGFDGVEVHGANSYLLDQFLQDVTNNRTDEYGGSIENRIKFPLGVLGAVVKAVGAEKAAIRISVGMKDPVPTFSAYVNRIRDAHPELSYLHLVEPPLEADKHFINADQSNKFIADIWGPRPIIYAGGFQPDTAKAKAEANERALVAFGRSFISNPDLVTRLENNIPLNTPDFSTFYGGGEKGYIDYPFADAAKPVAQAA
ncbi:putative NADPH2 dehydrogenase chain OYE2 [Amylostereum chailletii]|nr:putative NADPH2 dehydrogenase chain OYE2 [Amylostereum chailletii]